MQGKVTKRSKGRKGEKNTVKEKDVSNRYGRREGEGKIQSAKKHVGKRIKARAEVTLGRVGLRVGREEKRKRHYGRVIVTVARYQKPEVRKEAGKSVFL